MPRFRLRFLLQEFDLAGPEVLIGRSPECHITIEDPLISRQHARVVIRDEQAVVQDLGSRNGVRVNGRAIDAEHPLREGDRIRIGTQELVFVVVRAEARASRTTGYMRVCHACGTPYPDGTRECPHCGAASAVDEDTMSGMSLEPKRSWTFQLLAEVIERALAAGKALEAERLMRRAAKEIDERLALGERLDPTLITTVSRYGLRLGQLSRTAEWGAWALALHKRQGIVVEDGVIECLEDLGLDSLPEGRSQLDGYVAWARARGAATPIDEARLARLARLS